jgi:class 3 adenylate cyclase
VDQSSVKRRLTCILAADAVGYSKQMGQDEEGTIRVLSAHRSVIDGIIVFHQGRIISTAGDSVLAEFSSVVEAVRCAVEIQEALKTRNDSLPEHRQMHFRVGVNLGDVVVKNDDLLGDGVNVAARLESMAEPGGICIASSVYDQITGKLDLGFQDIGEQSLKNISRPVRVYRVSGTSPAVRMHPDTPVLPPVAATRSSLPLVIGAVIVLVVAGVFAWRGGWLRSGSTESAKSTATVPAVIPQTSPAMEKSATPKVSGDSGAAELIQAGADAQRIRSEAEAIKRQAAAELSRARSDALTQSKEVQAVKSAQSQKPRESVPAAVVAQDKSAQAATDKVVRFDGLWKVTIDCPKHEDGALGYTAEFPADVKDGTLRGEKGVEDNPGWLTLRGDIQTDGSARLYAKGLTGDPKLSIGKISKGTPYAYQVTAHFDGKHGTGRRLQVRACVLNFVKQ